MNGCKFQTSFCHHICGNRRINTAAYKNSSIAACTYRNTARTFMRRTVNISAKITNLYIYDKIRIMNINAKMREFIKNNSAEICASRNVKGMAIFLRFRLFGWKVW